MDTAKEIMKLCQQYKDVFPHIRYDYIQRNINNTILAIDNDILVGFIIYHIYSKTSSGLGIVTRKGDIQLSQIAVSKQGSGVANNLFKQLENFSFANNINRIVLSVRSENTRARRFYENVGMEEAGKKMWALSIPGTIYIKYLVSRFI